MRPPTRLKIHIPVAVGREVHSTVSHLQVKDLMSPADLLASSAKPMVSLL